MPRGRVPCHLSARREIEPTIRAVQPPFRQPFGVLVAASVAAADGVAVPVVGAAVRVVVGAGLVGATGDFGFAALLVEATGVVGAAGGTGDFGATGAAEALGAAGGVLGDTVAVLLVVGAGAGAVVVTDGAADLAGGTSL
jgi:hypothetical protein